jgi:hypothetical protein
VCAERRPPPRRTLPSQTDHLVTSLGTLRRPSAATGIHPEGRAATQCFRPTRDKLDQCGHSLFIAS